MATTKQSSVKDLSNIKPENWVHFKLKPGEKIFMCKKCLTLSTRPRAAFDEDGVCNACRNMESKKSGAINWDERKKYLKELCDKYRRDDGRWDVLVPGSGGKDSVSVAWKMKHELGMHPLCVMIANELPNDIGRKNFDNWVKAGFDVVQIHPDPTAFRKLAKIGFIEQGRPKMPFVTGIETVSLQMAVRFDIPFVMMGEEGETEYGGVTTLAKKANMTRQEIIDYYFSGIEPDKHLGKMGVTEKDVQWFKIPSEEDLDRVGVFYAFWSWFEDWDPYGNYLFAKKNTGFNELPHRSIGTYTNFAQLDDNMQDLHAYMMYIKFGFGRAWSDAAIDIRRGALDREQAIELVKAYDGEFPEKYLQEYLDYFEMTEEEFFKTIDSFRSPDIWEKVDGEWKLKFDIDQLA